MHLESWSYQYSEQFLEGPVVSMTLVKQESKAACTLGESFGFVGNRVWVDKGARGVFKVKYSMESPPGGAGAGMNYSPLLVTANLFHLAEHVLDIFPNYGQSFMSSFCRL